MVSILLELKYMVRIKLKESKFICGLLVMLWIKLNIRLLVWLGIIFVIFCFRIVLKFFSLGIKWVRKFSRNGIKVKRVSSEGKSDRKKL